MAPSTGSSVAGGTVSGSTVSGSTVIGCTVLDACCVLAFVAIGRATHHDGETLSGLASTSWPFLTGLAVGLTVTRAWRRPTAIVPAGLGAWLGAAAIGMLLRVVAGQGTAPAFIAVALAFLGLFLLGWRAAAAGWRWLRAGRSRTGVMRRGSSTAG